MMGQSANWHISLSGGLGQNPREAAIPTKGHMKTTLVQPLVSSQRFCSGTKFCMLSASDTTTGILSPTVCQASSAREDMKEQELAG